MTTIIRQAGAIVVREVDSRLEVLLIFSKKKPKIRIFPKGHIETGETPEETAHRELLEEAGVKAALIKSAETITYIWNEKMFNVAYFLFRYMYNVSVGEEGREPLWVSPTEAYEMLGSDDLRELFRVALESLPR